MDMAGVEDKVPVGPGQLAWRGGRPSPVRFLVMDGRW